MKNKVKIFVVPYFGEFPNYFQLWLNSCRQNPSFSWLVITDAKYSNYSVPSNVIFKKSSLIEVKTIIQKNFNDEIKLDNPYKLCDYRPVFWQLLDYYKLEYDFWGYCDLDVIFGKLSNFITSQKLMIYERIYSEGHLTLISSNKVSKNSFKLTGPNLTFEKVISTYKNLGFDEHHGLNAIWKKNKLSFFEDKSIVIDFDPRYAQTHMTYLPNNKKNQIFIYEKGQVYQIYLENNKLHKKEYCYIHFQKRKMFVPPNFNNSEIYQINENGFFLIDIDDIISQLNLKSKIPLIDELRNWYRFFRNNYKL